MSRAKRTTAIAREPQSAARLSKKESMEQELDALYGQILGAARALMRSAMASVQERELRFLDLLARQAADLIEITGAREELCACRKRSIAPC